MRRNGCAAYVVETFEHLNPASRPGQVGSGHQAVVAAADDDGVQRPFCHVTPDRSASIAFDLVGPTFLGEARILSRVTQRTALPQQVPTLVEGDFQRSQSLLLFGFIDFPLLQFGPELLLFGNEPVNFGEDVLIFGHTTSLPDYR